MKVFLQGKEPVSYKDAGSFALWSSKTKQFTRDQAHDAIHKANLLEYLQADTSSLQEQAVNDLVKEPHQKTRYVLQQGERNALYQCP